MMSPAFRESTITRKNTQIAYDIFRTSPVPRSKYCFTKIEMVWTIFALT